MRESDKDGALRICYFGTYSMEEGYPRNRVIIKGLIKNGADVVECHEDFWDGTEEKLGGMKDGFMLFKKVWKLLKVYIRLVKKYRRVKNYDVVVVGYAGHFDVFLARILNLFRKKPLIFDAFLSLYDTAVADRRIVPPGSFKAKLLRLIDTWSCRVADAVLLDTPAHIDYFVKEFHLPAEKFFAVPVGSSLKVQENSPIHHDNPSFNKGGMGRLFNVLYFGSYIPLHGVDVILKAAKLLEGENDVIFRLIGVGQLLSEMKDLAKDLRLKNVVFIDRFMMENELIQNIRDADLCLGIFGKTAKAQRVIPCKVYNCMAMGKPIVTAMTTAAKDVLIHKENAFLCKPADPRALSEAIRTLKYNTALREKIALQGEEYFQKKFSVEAIGKRVLDVIGSVA